MTDELPPMDQAEAQRLVKAISDGFGPCICQQHAAIKGHGLVWVEVCPGHEFLNEPHRLARLLWVYRTVGFWQGKEHGAGAMLNDRLRAEVGELLDGI